MAARVNASDMTNDFAEDRVPYRGTMYVLRELSMADYDKTVAQATALKDGEEVFDGQAHMKFLLAKSLVSPKLNYDELAAKGTRLVRALQTRVQKLHWDEEPEDKSVTDEEDAGEATAPAKP